MTTPAAAYMKRSHYAAHIGKTPGYVTQLAAQGRVVFTADGRFVDVAKTDALIAATASPDKQPVADRHAAARQAAADLRDADDEVQRHLPPNEPDADGPVLGYDFQLDRAKQQHFVAKKAEVEFLKEAKELCPRGDVVASYADAGAALRAAVRNAHPGLRVHGYRLRRSAARRILPPLRIGVAEDKVFGPVIYLGPSVHAGAGRVVIGLPPLNLNLAHQLVARSRFAEDAPADRRVALEAAASNALVRLSQLLTEVDAVVAIEIDPLSVEPGGVVALETAVRVEKRGRHLGFRRFAIRPYPKELEREVEWQGRQLLLRPIRPEDENTLGDLLTSLAAEDSRMRFFDTMRKLPRQLLARFTQIDYEREMALVAIERDGSGGERSLGEVRVVADPDNVVAEFALVISSSLKGKGLGRLLMASIIDYARSRGIHELRGETLAGNLRMQALARHCGFSVQAAADPGTVDLRLVLREKELAR